jgi:hypothetical protein
MASRTSVVLLLLAGCAEPALEVGPGHPANPDASVRPIAPPPIALSADYDPATHLPPPPGGGDDPHHHHHGQAPSNGGAAHEGHEP